MLYHSPYDIAPDQITSTQNIITRGSLLKTIRLVTLMSSIGCFLFFGCAPLQPRPESSTRRTPGAGHLDPADSGIILHELYQQVETWEGVPYRLGGRSKEGVDCSGFVYMTFLTRFNIKLPRSTLRQSRVGDYVFQRDLSAGDLVFFRTGYSSRHVGIYLENGLFAHASKSSGVMLSDLQDTYWSKRYWKAVRIKIDRP